jgi:PAS domain S-box-containing protein
MNLQARFGTLLHRSKPPSSILGYLVAVAATACSLALSLYLRPVTYQTPYLPYYVAVLVAVLSGGFRCGIVATLLSAVAVHYYLLPPYNSFEITLASTLQGMYFCVTFSVICWLIDRRKVRADSELENRLDDLRRGQSVSSTGNWRIDVRRNELMWSDEAYKIFGIALGTSLTYESFLAAVHPEDREMVDARWKAALKGEAYDIEHRIILGDCEKWVRETAELEFDDEGKLRGGFGSVQDITKRKQAELELQASESRLRTVLDTMPVGVWLADAHGVIVFANPAAFRIWAGARYIPIDQHDQFKAWWYGTKNLVSADEWALSRALRNGETALNELVEIECFDGQHRIINNSGVPIKDKQGHIIGALAINEDVTDRKKAEETLIRTEKLATAGRFAATIAHEIRNPLESITGLTYLLKRTSGLPPRATEMLNDLDRESQRIGDIVQNTLTLHRDSRTPVEFSVAKDVNIILERCRSKSENNRVKIKTSGWSNDATIVGYPGEFRQVVTNLLANALDAAEPGGIVAVRVRQVRGDQSGAVRITVADNGCGVPSALQSKLFEPFFTTKEASGTGLGLWVTRRLLEHCGGTIRMRSATTGLRRGTTFTAVFPSTTKTKAGASTSTDKLRVNA